MCEVLGWLFFHSVAGGGGDWLALRQGMQRYHMMGMSRKFILSKSTTTGHNHQVPVGNPVE